MGVATAQDAGAGFGKSGAGVREGVPQARPRTTAKGRPHCTPGPALCGVGRVRENVRAFLFCI